MKIQRSLEFLQRHGRAVGPVLLGLVLLVGCGGGQDEGTFQQGSALLPDGGAGASSDSSALDAYDLDQELAAVEEQLGVPLGELQGVMAESEANKQNEIVQEASARSADPEPVVQDAPIEAAPSVPAPAAQTSASPAPAVTGDFGLQLGSFRDLARANVLADRLRELGHRPVIETAEVNGQIWQRVCLWGMSDKASAIRLGERLHNEVGTDYLVRQRS